MIANRLYLYLICICQETIRNQSRGKPSQVLTTNVIRNKRHSDVSPKCTFCKIVNEAPIHLLMECKQVKHLWDKLERWCEYYLGHKITITKPMMVLNNYKGPMCSIVNTFIIIMKQYFYASKCYDVMPKFTGFVEKCSYWYLIKKAQTTDNNKIYALNKKWKNPTNTIK